MTCENKTIVIKTGSEADFEIVYYADAVDDEGLPVPAPISLEGYSIDMDFIEAKTGNILKECSTVDGSIIITEVAGVPATTGTYIVYGGSTLGWQLGKMPVDIKYTLNGKSQHTEDLILDITKGRSQ